VAVLERVPVGRVAERAAALDPARLLLSLLAAPLVTAGWLAYWAVAGAGAALRWTAAAFLVGHQLAREGRERRVGRAG
jgi:hypothetical protein